VKNYLDRAISDEKLSPEEEKEFYAISSSLNVEIKMDKKNKDHLEKLKLFWIIENGVLPVLEIDINLQKNEQCYFESYVDWYEERRHNWTLIDSGNVYLTNKRVLFMGNSKNTNIRFEKILSCTIRPDGVEIDKDAGKIPILKPKKDAEIMGRILKRLIKNYN
jgi:hypothetical protein